MAMPVASLGMYDLPRLRGATDALWRGLARHLARNGIAPLPRALCRHMPYDTTWRQRGLVFSQTCGYPLTHGFAGALTYLATPIYDAPGCVGPFYSSAILVREDETAADIEAFRGRVLALNGWDSQSGMNCLRPLCAPRAREGRFFGAVLVSGGHVNSIRMLREGRADICAADAVTVALVQQEMPERLSGLKRLRWSPPAPALPYVAPAGMDAGAVDAYRMALFDWIGDPTLAAARRRLRLVDIEILPLEAYASIPEMRIEAERRGYFELHAPAVRPMKP